MEKLRAPFPWFGGKSRVADAAWDRVGKVRNLVVPFCGSMAFELACPEPWWESMIVTVNDADAHLANFWRAVAADPDLVAHYADGPVNEADLHARHRWLVETAGDPVINLSEAERASLGDLLGEERSAAVVRLVDRWDGSGFLERMKSDPEFHDARRAGWWVWGQCLWIGSGWCAKPEWTSRGHAGGKARGIHRKMPSVGSVGRGVHRSAVKEVAQKRPALTGHGGGNGVHKPSLGAKRPVLAYSEGGRGIHRLSHQVPRLTGTQGVHCKELSQQVPDLEAKYGKRPALGSAGGNNGVHRVGIHRSGGLHAYMQALSDRLRRVRVCCGDFERVLGPAVTTCIGLTCVFLDPPYPEEDRAICYNHDGEGVWWRAYEWAIANGEDPLLRIALCGYEHPDAVFPAGWTVEEWKASGGYGARTERGQANARRERVWYSPGCLPAGQATLFEVEG